MTPEQKELLENWSSSFDHYLAALGRGISLKEQVQTADNKIEACKIINFWAEELKLLTRSLLAAQRAKDAEEVDSAIGWLITPDMKRPLRTPYESYLFNKLIGLRKEMYKRIYNQNES